MSLASIEMDEDSKIGIIVLDNPAKRNALSHELIDEVLAALQTFHDRQIRAVILRARAGAKVWSAGHDVSQLPDSRRDPLSWNDPLVALVRQIMILPAPVIAMLEGGVWGAACEVALACDIAIATPNTTFAVTPAKLGVPYSMTGILHFMNRIPLAVLKEMLFTAQPIEAERALRLGIVNHLVAAEDIEPFTMDIARKIAANSPLSVAAMKETIRILAGAHTLAPNNFERIQGLRRKVWDSDDYKEGIRAFRERRPPQFKGE